MTRRETELLIEQGVSAWRPPDGGVRSHPAWTDLDPSAREQLFDETVRSRTLEAALDDQGLTSTARAVLGRIR